MKKKGFTLIELLAVIVILAIIALIATPIVLNTIKSAQKGAAERSAENYMSAVETAVAASLLGEDKIEDGVYAINSDGNLTKGDKTYTIEVSGDKPKSGIIKIENGQVVKNSQTKLTQTKLTIGDYQVTYDSNNKTVADKDERSTSKACTIVSGDGTNVGDEIACGTENFYVMSYDSETITMLAKYNLKVGRIYNSSSSTDFDEILPINDADYGLQNLEMIGWTTSNSYPEKGAVIFANSKYWTEYTESNVYDENSNLYQHVEAYETYLKGNGVSTAEASLMSKEQAVALGCSSSSCSSAPDWVYSTTYWIGSSGSMGNILSIYFGGLFIDMDYGSFSPARGIRPVVTISVDEI